MKALIAAVLVTLGLIGPAFAQGAAKAGPPLLITPTTVGGTALAYTMRNMSGKEVRAYTLAIQLQDRLGAPVGQIKKIAIRGIVPGGRETYKPGEVTQERLRGLQPNATVRGYTSSLDFVLFADDSSWGPDRLKTSKQIRAMLDGHRLTLGGLKDMLSQQGPEAVVAYLKARD